MIPGNVQTIEANVFAYCTGLTSIIIPENVTSLGNGVFSNCSKLETVTALRATPAITAAGTALFGPTRMASLEKILVPTSVVNVYRTVENWSPHADIIFGIDGEPPNQTPVAGDYNFDNMNQTAGSVTAVSIEPKAGNRVTDVTVTPKNGKSAGAVTIKYNGSATIPQTDGTYTVTFDIAETSNWETATSLSTGNLLVYPDDYFRTYDPFSLVQYAGSVSTLGIFTFDGGMIGTYYYNGSYQPSGTPQTAGTYAITFQYTPPEEIAVTIVFYGYLVVLPGTPVAGDYLLRKKYQYDDVAVVPVTLTPSYGKSTGALSIYYEGIDGTIYTKSSEVPQTAGTYKVTFDVAAVASAWHGTAGLVAGNLKVMTPGDYKLGDTDPGNGKVFYDKGEETDGWRYLEITTSNIGTAPINYITNPLYVDTEITGTSTDIGTGKANTDLIFAADSGNNTAVYYCKKYAGGGQNDWFLPSRDELYEFFINIEYVNLSSFNPTEFWTSSQYGDWNVWIIFLPLGQIRNSAIKAVNAPYGCSVRAVRSF